MLKFVSWLVLIALRTLIKLSPLIAVFSNLRVVSLVRFMEMRLSTALVESRMLSEILRH